MQKLVWLLAKISAKLQKTEVSFKKLCEKTFKPSMFFTVFSTSPEFPAIWPIIQEFSNEFSRGLANYSMIFQ